MTTTNNSNVIDFASHKAQKEVDGFEGSFDFDSAENSYEKDHQLGEDIQLWSALTLGSLQKQLTGREEDPQCAEAKILVDELARRFATTGALDIAAHFEAVAAVASALNPNHFDRLQEIEAADPQAA